MRQISFAVLMLVAFGDTACGPGSFRGTVQGRRLNVADAVFYMNPVGGEARPGLRVFLSDDSGLCSELREGRRQRSSNLFEIFLTRGVFADEEVDEGSYMIGGDAVRSGDATFQALDATCRYAFPPSDGAARSGTVELQKVQTAPGGQVEGTFAMSIGSQADEVNGDFSAVWCDLSAPPPSVTCN